MWYYSILTGLSHIILWPTNKKILLVDYNWHFCCNECVSRPKLITMMQSTWIRAPLEYKLANQAIFQMKPEWNAFVGQAKGNNDCSIISRHEYIVHLSIWSALFSSLFLLGSSCHFFSIKVTARWGLKYLRCHRLSVFFISQNLTFWDEHNFFKFVF